jgi:SAM-dependent methyltransferase
MAALGDIDLSYTIVACARCHSVFADEIASREEYEKYYSLYSKYDTGGTPSQETCMIHEKLVNIVSKYFDEPICGVVDIGCGSGNLLATFGKRFQHIALIGIDPSPETAYHRLKNFKHVEINKGFIENVDVVNRECNVFCLTAVLEHLENPFAALLALSERLSERDCLAIEFLIFRTLMDEMESLMGSFPLSISTIFLLNLFRSYLNELGLQLLLVKSFALNLVVVYCYLLVKKEGSLSIP